MVRLQLAGVDQFIWLYQRDISRKGYQGVKVAGAKVIGQVAKCVATMSANERQVGAQRAFEQLGFTVECQCLFAFLYDGADTSWGEKTTKSSSATANLLD